MEDPSIISIIEQGFIGDLFFIFATLVFVTLMARWMMRVGPNILGNIWRK